MSPQPIITRLDINRFRGLNALSLDNLSHVNVLVGANNCGKTSILETIMLLGAPMSFRTVVEMALSRVSPGREQEKKNRIAYVLSMFQHEKDKKYLIDLGAVANNFWYGYKIEAERDKRLLTYRIDERTHLLATKLWVENMPLGAPSCAHEWGIIWSTGIANGGNYDFSQSYIQNYDGNYHDEDDSGNQSVWDDGSMGYYKHYPLQFGDLCNPFFFPASKVNYHRLTANFVVRLLQDGKKTDLLKVLRIFEPDIEDVNVVEGEVYLSQDHRPVRMMPLYTYGYGLQKAAALVTATINMEDSVLLVDEIENAIHMSAFEEVFGWFLEACLQYRVQAFLTTHSAEALDAILRVAHDRFSDRDILRAITLRKDQEANITRKIIRTGEEAYEDRERFEEELRV